MLIFTLFHIVIADAHIYLIPHCDWWCLYLTYSIWWLLMFILTLFHIVTAYAHNYLIPHSDCWCSYLPCSSKWLVMHIFTLFHIVIADAHIYLITMARDWTRSWQGFRHHGSIYVLKSIYYNFVNLAKKFVVGSIFVLTNIKIQNRCPQSL